MASCSEDMPHSDRTLVRHVHAQKWAVRLIQKLKVYSLREIKKKNDSATHNKITSADADISDTATDNRRAEAKTRERKKKKKETQASSATEQD
ncbi:hypothetical protein EVAR_62449_1 [Eumeta japonica]|uniref:Uncharacterized protein n=1 Tax=Eumeta variegata TaxID=151549 RepID=A0A4C1Z2Z6_EUMVA|nr:hypothetical protein EVAR_62449_1 [Eumeta japonica]